MVVNESPKIKPRIQCLIVEEAAKRPNKKWLWESVNLQIVWLSATERTWSDVRVRDVAGAEVGN